MEEIKKTLKQVGWKFGLMAIWTMIIEAGGDMLIKNLFPVFYESYETEIMFIGVVLALDMTGFPLLYLMLKNMPKGETEHHKFGFKNYIVAIFILCALEGIGIVLGFPFHFALTFPFGINPNDASVAGKIVESNIVIRTLVAGIGAPIFEELIFRKLLIDRTIKHGKLFSLLLSGFMFGLFHGNFQQFFYAMFIGFLLAFIYIKTGNVVNTMLVHATMNLYTTVIYSSLFSVVFKHQNDIDELFSQIPLSNEAVKVMIASIGILACLLLMLCMALTGIILMVIGFKKKKFAFDGENTTEIKNKTKLKAYFTTPMMYVYYGMMILVFLDHYLVPVISKMLK